MLKSILLSSVLLNIGILLGRLSGFVRESIVGAVYGVSNNADTVVLMLTVPDLLVNILIGGALGVVLIPEFTKSPELSRRLLFQSIVFFGIIFFFLALFLYFNMGALMSVLAPGFSSIAHNQSIDVVRWVIWLVPLTVMAGVTTAFLQTQNQYAIPAIGTLIVNCCIIAGLLIIKKTDGDLYLLALFILIGGGLRLLSQIAKVGDVTLSPLKSMKPFLINKALMVRYMQAMVSGSALLLFPVIARSQATYLGEGSLAILNYGIKLIEFPMVLTVTFLSVVLLPKLSKSYFENKTLHIKIIKYGLQITLILSILVACSLSAISESYSSIVFGYGRMTDGDLIKISHIASLGMLLLPLMGLSTYLTAVYNSRQNTSIPLAINFLGLLAFMIMCKNHIYGYDLKSIIWSMISGYALISLSLISFLRIRELNWLHILFEKNYSFNLLASAVLVYISCAYIQSTDLSNWIIISLSAFSSALFLLVALLFNTTVRNQLILKIRRL